LDEATAQTLFGSICDGLKSGSLKVYTPVADGAEQIGNFFR